MSDPPPSTMAPSEAAAPSRAPQQARNASSNAPAQQVTKSLVTREIELTLRAFFPTPPAPNKFNPIQAMNRLLRIMIKDEPSLVLRNANNDRQIVLASESLPTSENGFKQFFKVSTLRNEKQNQTHVCIGCYVLSNRSLGNIKFQSNDGHLLNWLKKERVFVEADSLGIDRPVNIGYFTKIAPEFTNLPNFRDHLINQLMLIDLDANTAVELAPYLKDAQLDAMTNGDEYVPILPPFEVYKTRISHGRAPSQVSTEVIGIKGAPRDAKILGEFFTRLATETNSDDRNGKFIPKGASYLLGEKTYERVLKENNFFLSNVATIPINIEFGAWFAVIDPNQSSESEPISLHEHLLRQPWFLRVESVAKQKCYVVTTRPNLPAARAWIDSNLEPLIRKSLPPGSDPPSSQLPHRLDKPVYSESSRTYADILKQQFSLAPNASMNDTENNRPPRKRQASIIDYDSDTSKEHLPHSTTTASTSTTTSNRTQQSATPTQTMTSPAYAMELQALKTEIDQLKTLIANAVEQITQAIVSIHITPCNPPTNAMDTEVSACPDTSTVTSNHQSNQLDLPVIIQELKHNITTQLDMSHLIVDIKSDLALIKSHPLFCNLRPINQHVPMT